MGIVLTKLVRFTLTDSLGKLGNAVYGMREQLINRG